MEIIRKILAITTTRADYGVLRPLLVALNNDEKFNLKLVVTGTHLDPEFGLTVNEIDDLEIYRKIEIALATDSFASNVKSMALLQIGLSDILSVEKPDIMIVLGDRFELLPIVSSCLIFNVPVAHISGGEITKGALDDSVRHAVTKMSHIHFAATEDYRKRIIQLGEDPKLVFNVGEPGLEDLENHSMASSNELNLPFGPNDDIFLITFHPETSLSNNSHNGIDELLNALKEFTNFKFIFTSSNTDNGGRDINKKIKKFCDIFSENSIYYPSLGRSNYLFWLKKSILVIGNSSSGIIEAPIFDLPTINIGERQFGRSQAKSIINCSLEKESIIKAISLGLDTDYRKLILTNNVSPYVKNNSIKSIINVLGEVKLDKLIAKNFFDLEK